MLLQVKHSGQLCNRLFSLLPTISYAIHNRVKLYVLFEKKEYLDYFPNIYKNPYVKFIFQKDVDNLSSLEKYTMWISKKPKKNLGAKFERALLRMADKQKNNVEGDLRDWQKKNSISFVDGWEHRLDCSYIKEERDILMYLFQPLPEITKTVDAFFDNYNGVTVGVHVRRGDYKNHRGGIWYYDDDVYLKAIKKIKVELGANVRFLICSNEPFSMRNDVAEMFKLEPLYSTDCMTDLYGLSKCDYIIGAPSTFSQWASFIGNIPTKPILEKNADIHLSDFLPIVSLDTFADGSYYYGR